MGALTYRAIYNSCLAKAAPPAAAPLNLYPASVMDNLNVGNYRFGNWWGKLGHYPTLDAKSSLGHSGGNAFNQTISIVLHLI